MGDGSRGRWLGLPDSHPVGHNPHVPLVRHQRQLVGQLVLRRQLLNKRIAVALVAILGLGFGVPFLLMNTGGGSRGLTTVSTTVSTTR